MDILETAKRAKSASIALAAASTELKNRALKEIQKALKEKADSIVWANQTDLDRAAEQRLDPPLMKRLRFDTVKIEETCAGLESLIKLADPVGETLSAIELDSGLELYKVSCPIGVIGMIFESRPDALVQISSLCLKSGNAVLLKGGKEAQETNRLLAHIIARATARAGIPDGWIGLLETRDDVAEMLKLEDHINMIVPRGSNAFVKHIMDSTSIPVMGHADGICHIYIDESADLDMAVRIADDSKTQYVAVCNAVETILVHRKIAAVVLPKLKTVLEGKGVEIRGCDDVRKIIEAASANEEDWRTEYLDYIVSIKVVDDINDAIDHINTYGSGHTDVIVTKKHDRAILFMQLVDSANVFLNCSTRFSDGYRFGLGAEVGISTGKIHARGPVGLEGLMIYQWRMIGSGQIVADYSGSGTKNFTHKKLNKIFNIE